MDDRYRALVSLVGKQDADLLLNKFKTIDRILQLDPPNLAASGACKSTINRIQAHKALRFAKPTALHSVEDIFYHFYNLSYREHEEFWVMYLDSSHTLLYKEMVGKGSIGAVQISSNAVVRRALIQGASVVIMVHNHPGGIKDPSEADIQFTIKVKAKLKQFDIELAEHMIICREEYFSMAEKGLV